MKLKGQVILELCNWKCYQRDRIALHNYCKTYIFEHIYDPQPPDLSPPFLTLRNTPSILHFEFFNCKPKKTFPVKIVQFMKKR